MKTSKEHPNTKPALWDLEYASHKWDILKSPMEQERFNTLVKLTREYCDRANILEMGCGEGLLLEKIASTYDSFLGIDISQVAIATASRLSNSKTKFATFDMDDFVPSGKFDIIIFNESVYYSEDPLGIIRKHMTFLNTNGVIATSIYGNMSGVRLIRRIEREFRCLKYETTVNQRGTWYCHVIDGGDK